MGHGVVITHRNVAARDTTTAAVARRQTTIMNDDDDDTYYYYYYYFYYYRSETTNNPTRPRSRRSRPIGSCGSHGGARRTTARVHSVPHDKLAHSLRHVLELPGKAIMASQPLLPAAAAATAAAATPSSTAAAARRGCRHRCSNPLGIGASDAGAHRRHGGDAGQLYRGSQVPIVAMEALAVRPQHKQHRWPEREHGLADQHGHPGRAWWRPGHGGLAELLPLAGRLAGPGKQRRAA